MTNPMDPLNLPRDAKLIALLLKAADIDDYEPRVLLQLMDFLHRYVSEVIQDAQVYADHANASKVRVDDLRLAIETKIQHSFVSPPDRQYMAQIAQKCNSKALPVLPDKFGVRLPADKFALTGTNFQILTEKLSRPKQQPAAMNIPAPPTADLPLAGASKVAEDDEEEDYDMD